MTQIFTFLQANADAILQGLTGVISGASVLANFTRTDKDNKALGALSKVVNFLAANFFILGAKPGK